MSSILAICGWLIGVFIAWKVWRRDWVRRWTSSMDHARRALAALILAGESGDDAQSICRLARSARVEILAGCAGMSAACGDCVYTRLLSSMGAKIDQALQRSEQSGTCNADDQDALRIALDALSQNP